MLTVDGSVNSRDARGGTAPIQVAKQLGVVRDTADTAAGSAAALTRHRVGHRLEHFVGVIGGQADGGGAETAVDCEARQHVQDDSGARFGIELEPGGADRLDHG